MVHHYAWSGQLVRSTRMVVSDWCVSCFFIGYEFIGLLSRRFFSSVFVLVCFSTLWLDYDWSTFTFVSNRLSCYFSREPIRSPKLESISALYRFCFLVRYITIF